MRVLLVSEGAHELGAWDDSGHPTGPSALQAFCRRLLGQKVEFVRKSVSHFYAAVAEHADLEHVAERCRRGFAPFARRVQAL